MGTDETDEPVIRPLDFDSDTFLMRLHAEGGGEVQEAWLVVQQLLCKAWGVEGFAELELSDLVTTESLEQWERGFPALQSQLEGYALSTRVRYLSPSWAVVLLPRDESPSGDTYEVVRDHAVPSLAAYVRWADPQWRVHLIGPPDVSVDQLPS